MNAKTSSVNLPPNIDPKIADAIKSAWEAGEIIINPASDYAGQLPKPGYEWWRTDWVRKAQVLDDRNHPTGETTDNVLYCGAFEMNVEYRKKVLKTNDAMIHAYLLFRLAIEFQKDENRQIKMN